MNENYIHTKTYINKPSASVLASKWHVTKTLKRFFASVLAINLI